MLFLLLFSCIQSDAAANTDTLQGSITILLTDGDIGTSKENVAFEYVKVADIKDGKYYLLEEYGTLDLNELKTSSELDEAAQTINASVKTGQSILTDKNGKAVISNLEIGVYLLRVSDKARYENVTPVLIAIPTWNEVDGDMNYNVTVMPKHTANEPGEIITSTPTHTDSNTVLTGDSSSYIPYIILMIGSAIACICVRTKKRRDVR